MRSTPAAVARASTSARSAAKASAVTWQWESIHIDDFVRLRRARLRLEQLEPRDQRAALRHAALRAVDPPLDLCGELGDERREQRRDLPDVKRRHTQRAPRESLAARLLHRLPRRL